MLEVALEWRFSARPGDNHGVHDAGDRLRRQDEALIGDGEGFRAIERGRLVGNAAYRLIPAFSGLRLHVVRDRRQTSGERGQAGLSHPSCLKAERC